MSTHALAGYGTELQALAMIESSGGRNLDHPVVEHGLNRGTRAGGAFGMMPKTAKDIISRTPALRKKYGNWVYVPNDVLTTKLNEDRAMDREIATELWKRLRSKMSKERAACSWFWGQYHSRCQGDAHLETAYVGKFRFFLTSR